MWACPFCGRIDQRSDEHVWAQWLRNYPAFKQMNSGYTGQRFKRSEYVVERDADGGYQEVEKPGRHVQAFVPHFQVSICEPCNKGWMSGMEDHAKAILDPMIGDQEVVLGRNEQELLAGWFAMCTYSYISDLDPKNVPFSPEEYRALLNQQRPPGRALIWMGHSTGPQAYVSMDVDSYIVMPRGSPTVLDAPASAANAFLAAHSVVFIGQWLPDENPDARDHWENELFATEWRAGLRRIWPYSGDIEWPTEDIPEDLLNIQIWFMDKFYEVIGLPFVGHTQEEIDQIAAEYWADGDPAELREKWDGRELELP